MTATHDVVLLHGALGASRQFDALARGLQPHFRIHVLDFEGHGSAPPRGRPFRIPFFAENVLELLDSKEIAMTAPADGNASWPTPPICSASLASARS